MSMKSMKKVFATLWNIGVIRLGALLILFCALAFRVADAYEILLADVRIEEAGTPEQVKIVGIGANLFRPNCLYVNDVRLEGVPIEKISYEECEAIVNRDVLNQPGWYKIELACSSWGVMSIKSTPVWIEWDPEANENMDPPQNAPTD